MLATFNMHFIRNPLVIFNFVYNLLIQFDTPVVIAKTLEVADTLNLNKLQGVARCEAIDGSNST